MRASPPAPARRQPAAGAAWPLGPRHPRIAPGELHVWVAALSRVHDSVGGVLDDSEREREREGRIARARGQAIWGRSRGVLRELLARYLRADARSLRLSVEAAGKPVLAAEPGGRAPLHFNVSHSGAVAVYAFATRPVGVDVELARRSGLRRDRVALARRAFGPPSAERLARLDREAQEGEFLRLWTRHEAALKLCGDGIGGGRAAAPADPWIAEL